MKFLDEVISIDKEAKRLKAKGVDIIIALGHSGFKMDKKIAQKVPDVDVVVGGHTNTFLYNGEPPSNEVCKKLANNGYNFKNNILLIGSNFDQFKQI